jgi:hypothetical protein
VKNRFALNYRFFLCTISRFITIPGLFVEWIGGRPISGPSLCFCNLLFSHIGHI